MYSPVEANQDQIDQLYKKHLRFPVFSLSFQHDDEDNIGFFECFTLTGKRVSGQIRNHEPMFIEFTGFGSTRYDISYPKRQKNLKFYQRLKTLCQKAENDFWKGSKI